MEIDKIVDVENISVIKKNILHNRISGAVMKSNKGRAWRSLI